MTMASPSAEDVIAAFARVVRKRLVDGKPVHVPGLGTFDVEHRSSRMKEDDDGSSYMAPPQDIITFDPEA